MKNVPISISTMGLDERSLEVFKIFFDFFYEDNYQFTNHHDESDISLIDRDIYKNDEPLKPFKHDLYNRTVIFLSLLSGETSQKNHYAIKKPIQPESLYKIFTEIQQNNNTDITSHNNKHNNKGMLNWAKDLIPGKPFNHKTTKNSSKVRKIA